MNPERSRVGPEAVVAAVLAAAVFALLGGAWLRGLSVFWSDLTYLHHGWRAAPAMLIAAGRAPLWEPSLYFGMPMAASMQGGLFYPATIVYYLFGFATATALFQALHVFTAGWLCALWLRACRLSWGASLGGALLFAFGGVMIARLPFLNHLATLAWAPALVLFFRHPTALALVLALMMLAGYPTFIPGCAVIAWIVAYAAAPSGSWSWKMGFQNWAKAGLFAGALSAVQLLPGLELAAHSRRSTGVGLTEALTWGFSPADLLQWIGPLAVGIKNFHPALDWTACVYLGLVGFFAAAYGAYLLPRRRGLIFGGALVGIVLLTLGASNPLSAALWRGLPPLRFVRYPGNLAYLALLPLASLAAAGFSGRRWGPLLVILSGFELLVIGRSATPLATRGLFVEPGPLVRALQASQDDARYLISPKALQASKGSDIFDWKQRLYGLTNAPYRLRSAANFGEPLVPAPSYAVMDAVLSLPSADAAARWMPWLGASRLLTPERVNSPGLTAEPRALWEISKVRGPVSIAYQLTPKEGASLPAAWPKVPPDAARSPLGVSRTREDRFVVSGEGEGWAYVAEPRYPGWTTVLSGLSGTQTVVPEPALGAFQKVETPRGPWTLSWRYEPRPWRLGLLLAFFSWILLGWSWYHRAVASGDIR
ncbi:MAG: hypothetical protein COV48_14090 [Elusimicrobia bacterium CG11_big_fil_rev_8_21_14_0_20_64_6]|nr:MAG: hypothetical protein COV48_14090 [Elusimicrobia bacterium CG11_big_fil_rev_8_21_14_0_20_64_6]